MNGGGVEESIFTVFKNHFKKVVIINWREDSSETFFGDFLTLFVFRPLNGPRQQQQQQKV